jgi:DNA repair exonuclease SbcCD ATPase subunit
MAIDDAPEPKEVPMQPEGSSHTQKFIALYVILAFLAVGEIYTLSQITSSRRALQSEVQKARQEMSAQLNERMVAMKEDNAQQLQGLEEELDQASKRLGSTGKELRRARTMVTSLQADQQRQAQELRHEIALKADQQQLGAISQDVNTTRTDLDSTKQTLNDAIDKLGMTRSEFGTLIARNHDEIETLRKLGDRDYFEFVLERKVPKHVAGIGLILKNANVKHNRFNLTLLADDMAIEKKNRTVNEPVFFYVGGSKRVYELVVNKVESKRVKGYISTPKGATQMATRAEGAL